MSFTSVTVTGTVYLGATGSPAASATVGMTLSSYITDGNSVIAATTQTAVCDANGNFTLTLPANDDPTTTPTGTYYSVVVASATGGQTLDSFNVVVPHADAPTVDLYSLPRLP